MKRHVENIYIDISSAELEVQVVFDYEPPVEGVYHLAPEDCFPSEEEEIDIVSISSGGTDISILLEFENIYEAICNEVKHYISIGGDI